MILFVTKNCPKCDYLKNQNLEGLEVHDVNTSDGLEALAWLELVWLAEEGLPILVAGEFVTNDINEITTLLKCEPYVEECKDGCRMGGGK